jgi:hypothetical protein
MIAAIVVPLGCLSNPRTISCFVPLRLETEAAFPVCAGFFASLADAAFVLLGMLRCDISQTLSVATAQAPSPPKPHDGGIASGAALSRGAKWPVSRNDTDALFAAEVQLFLQKYRAWVGAAFQVSICSNPLAGYWAKRCRAMIALRRDFAILLEFLIAPRELRRAISFGALITHKTM